MNVISSCKENNILNFPYLTNVQYKIIRKNIIRIMKEINALPWAMKVSKYVKRFARCNTRYSWSSDSFPGCVVTDTAKKLEITLINFGLHKLKILTREDILFLKSHDIFVDYTFCFTLNISSKKEGIKWYFNMKFFKRMIFSLV